MYHRRVPSGGDEEVRTLDLLRARQALSQLSYTPVLLSLLFPFEDPQNRTTNFTRTLKSLYLTLESITFD